MTWPNHSDVITQITSAGIILKGGALEIDTPKPVRCHVDGRGKEKRGWYWLNEKEIQTASADGTRRERYITGAFGVYEGNDNGKRTIKLNLDGKALKLSKEESEAIRARQAENTKRLAAMRKEEADRAAARAQHVWKRYVPTGESDYLKRKGVGAHGLRFSPSGNGTVAVPMLREGKIVGLQIIRGKNRPERQLEKEYFPAGMNKVGAFHLLGRITRRGVAIVAEGYATAATIFEALGQTVPVAVAFDAGSLAPVAGALRKEYPGVQILIAADDDRIQRCRECKHSTAVDMERCVHCDQPHGAHNPGVEAAANAAHAVNGSHIVPQFTIERANDSKGPNDFNDLAAAEGLHVVRQQLEAHLAGLGWHQTAPAPRLTATQGGGEAANFAASEATERAAIPSQIDTIDAMVRYSMVYAAKATWFDHVEHMLVSKSDALDLVTGGWREIKLRGGLPVVRLDEVGFDPACTDTRIKCNLWSGWPTEPKDGSCKHLLAVLEHLCSAEKHPRELYHWVLKWLAYPIQNPGAKMRTALVFHGPQGVGKNLFFEAVMAIYGKYGRIVDQSAVEDKFNDWLSGKLFLIADEVVARNELYHLKNKLKGIVTGEWIRINPKNVAAHDERNHVNLVFLSNEKQPLVLEKDDRRYVVCWTPEKLESDFYEEVRAELREGGVAALHHYLATLDLTGFDEFARPPATRSKEELIDQGLDSIERFVRDWYGGEIAINGVTVPFAPAGSADLYAIYKRWCVMEGVARPREQAGFKGHIVKLKGWNVGHRDRFKNEACTGGKVRQRFILPSDEDMQAAATLPGAQDWRNGAQKQQAEWLTECFFAVHNVLGDPQ